MDSEAPLNSEHAVKTATSYYIRLIRKSGSTMTWRIENDELQDVSTLTECSILTALKSHQRDPSSSSATRAHKVCASFYSVLPEKPRIHPCVPSPIKRTRALSVLLLNSPEQKERHISTDTGDHSLDPVFYPAQGISRAKESFLWNTEILDEPR